ncbi:MAG: type II toxin-antitoxin system VapC family toxin [Drouetiella hepatica Uher 2000/2452]|uniref:Type II toxin-antitoxin system VapC family toxin n=1 Tax=Drouetiella hepatica Uher 2000/2452 TaxID=904376 RepID=A0A951QIV3_9CYAN|nr:type II toxin-antitoxin system VapC family toxin [Drouetiella hepatica Uher 2000/2452]
MNGVRFLLDTNYVIGLVKQQEAVVKVVTDRTIETKACVYSFVTRIELLGFPGITSQEIDGIERTLAQMQYTALTKEIEDCTIALRRNYRLKTPDAIIAATAKCLTLELLTLDQQLVNRMQEIEANAE